MRILQYSTDGELIKVWESASQIQKVKGWYSHLILNVCHKIGCTAYGYCWCFEGKEPVLLTPKKERKVVQYNLDGSVVKVWNNAREVYKTNGWSDHLIGNVCKKWGYTAYGYGWAYEGQKWDNSKVGLFENKKIIQYNKNGDVIKIWDNISDVIKFYNLNKYHFKEVLSKRTATYKGYGWSYDGKSWGKNANTKIYQYDKNTMELIKIWQRISVAASELGIDASSINACVNKRMPSYKGYIWRRGLEQD